MELAEALNAPVVDIGGRMNFPTTHYLCHSVDRRSLVAQADVALLLEWRPWNQFNTISDPHHEYRRLAKPTSRSSTFLWRHADEIKLPGYATFMPVDLPISGDAQATLPALTEAVKMRSR